MGNNENDKERQQPQPNPQPPPPQSPTEPIPFDPRWIDILKKGDDKPYETKVRIPKKD